MSAHQVSSNARNAPKYSRTVLGIEPSVTTETTYVLNSMHARGTVETLLKDEDLLLLQVVEQSDIVGSHEDLGTPGIHFARTEPVQDLAGDVQMKIAVNLVEDARNASLERRMQSRQKVEEELRSTGFEIQVDRFVQPVMPLTSIPEIPRSLP